MYLLDTDTVIFNLKGDPIVQENLRYHLNDPMSICVITLMELYYGAYKSEQIAANISVIRTLEHTLDIIQVGTEIAQTFAMLKAQLEKAGARLDDFDLIIAACAMAHNLTLVTNNERHFKRIPGLKMTNWARRQHNGR